MSRQRLTVSHPLCQDPSGAQHHIFLLSVAVLSMRGPSLTRGRVSHLSRLKSVVHVIYISTFTCYISVYVSRIYTRLCQSRLGTPDRTLTHEAHVTKAA